MARILIKDLSVDTDYAAQVRSVRDGKVSAWSNYAPFRTVKDTTPPANPTDLDLKSSGSNFVATWTPPTTNLDGSDLNDDLKDYVVTLTAPARPSATPPTIEMNRVFYTQKASFEITAEENKATFFSFQDVLNIKVQSRDYANNVSPGVTDTATKATPNPVTALTLGLKGAAFVASWTAPTQNTDATVFEDFKHYEVRITDGTLSVTFLSADPTYSFSFDDVKAIFGSMRYTVTVGVRAVNAVGGRSTEVTATATKPAPGPPTALTWVSVGDAFAASWTAPTGVEDLAGYDVTVTANSLSTTYKVTDTKFELSAEENGRIFTTGINRTPQGTVAISIKSRDSLGQLSTAVTATASNPVPAAPTALTATAVYDAIELSWTAPTLNVDGSNFDDLKYYEVQVSSDGVTYTGSWYLGTDPQYTHLTVSTANHYFRVRVYDKFMQPSAWSNAVGPFKPKNAYQVDATAPAQVTGVTAVPLNANNTTPSGLRVSWTAVANPTNDLAGYTVRYLKSGSTVYQFVDVPSDITTVDIEGLSSGGTYGVSVRAYDFVANKGAWSTTVNATANTETAVVIPPKTDLAPPSSSPTPTVTPLYGALEIKWAPVANADPITYEVHVSTTSGFTPVAGGATRAAEVSGTFAIVKTLPGTTTALTYGTTYYVRLIAKDFDGAAAPGTQASGVTLQIDNGDIATNAVRANHIFAGSVTADKLNVVGGGANMMYNSSFEDTSISDYSAYYADAGAGLSAVRSTAAYFNGTASLLVTPNIVGSGMFGHAPLATIVPANTKVVSSAWVKGTAGNVISIAARTRTPAGAGQSETQGSKNWTLTGFWQRIWSDPWTHTADFNPGLQIRAVTGTAPFNVDAVQVEIGEIASGYTPRPLELLPGTITGTLIAGNTITTGNISTGGLDAGVLTAGSTFTKNLNVGAVFTMATNGEIKSSNYGGTTGYQLTTSGLTILSGTIAARALQIQEGSNLVPAPYADFEFRSDFYTTGIGAVNSTFSVVTDAKYNGQAIKWVGTGTAQKYMYLSSSWTNYNIPVEIGEYIYSVWVKNNLATATNISLSVRSNDGTTYPSAMAPTLVPASQGYTRYSGVFTVVAGTTAVIPYVENNQGQAIDFTIDGVQIERKSAGSNTPSPWRPPGLTSIDGAVIRTGEIRSATTVAYDGTTQPMWSINTQGSMQINEAAVRGKIIVGSATNSAGALVQSNNYGGTGKQWAIKGDGSMEFRSGSTGASRIEFDSTGFRAFSGATETVNINASTGAAKFAGDLSGSSISNNGGTFAVTTAGALTASSGTIGGWNIGPNYLNSGGLYLYTPENMIYAGSGANRIGMKAGVGFWAGSESQNTTAPFFVGTNGALSATNATLKGAFSSSDNRFIVDTSGNGTISGNFNVYGHLEIGASSTSTDAYVIVRNPSSGNWLMLDGRSPGTYPYALDTSTQRFRVDYDGNLTANNVNISGTVTATSGTFTGTVNASGGTFSNTVYGGAFEGSTFYTGGYYSSRIGLGPNISANVAGYGNMPSLLFFDYASNASSGIAGSSQNMFMYVADGYNCRIHMAGGAGVAGQIGFYTGAGQILGINTSGLVITGYKTLSFGSQTTQMINLYGNGYGIGVQPNTLYFRSDAGFAWHKGGSHSDGDGGAGAGAGGGVTIMRLTSAGQLHTSTGSIQTSSLRNKTDIQNWDARGLEIINSLRPTTFKRTDLDAEENDKTRIGLIAEEVGEVLPEYVAYDLNGQTSGIDYAGLTTPLIKAVQELSAQVDFLKAQIAELTAK